MRDLLVSPTRACHRNEEYSLRHRLVPWLLRSYARTARSLFGGRGIGFACLVAAKLMSSKDRIYFRLGNGAIFGVAPDDRYWLYYLLIEQEYETDLEHFLLQSIREQDSFLDCGANLGLWSTAIGRIITDARRIVAIEAGTATFSSLQSNWRMNDRSFTLLHRAIGTRTGQRVTFFASAGDHASATMVENLCPTDSLKEEVETISLNDLLEEQRTIQDRDDALVFIKLDIEGMEREVISTIAPEDNPNVIVIYEDHGSTNEHVTAFVLEKGFSVFFLHDGGQLELITKDNIDRLTTLKENPMRGYNLVAVAPHGAALSRIASSFPIPKA